MTAKSSDEGTTPDPRLIGMRIALRRAELHMNAAELGRRVGSNPTMVWKWESGVHVPGTDKLARIAKALQTTADKLLAPPENLPGDNAPPTAAELAQIDEVLPGVHSAEHRAIALKILRVQAAADARKRGAGVSAQDPSSESEHAPTSTPPPPRAGKRRRARTA